MIVQQVEKHVINKNHPYYTMFCEFTHQSKNLYNRANYLVRKEFVESGKWLRYHALCKLLRHDLDYPDYADMPAAQSAQQTLRLLDANWKSFFKSSKDWSKNKDKYLGRPKLPKYKPKDGQMVVFVTNQQVKQKGDLLTFPKPFRGFTIKPRCSTLDNFEKLNQVRIVPQNQIFCVEIVYSIAINDTPLQDNGRIMSIKKNANDHRIAKKMNNKNYTNRLHQLTRKRNFKIEDALHKISRFIVDTAAVNNINTIVVGNNQGWKQSISLGRKTNQSFVTIPHQKLIEKICYKAKLHGIRVIITEESCTSGTSFLDGESPTKDMYDKKRRIYRGLFRSNQGVLINADVNAGYQILKKVFPNEFSDGVEGVVFHPVRVNII